ncbi:Subunit of heteropentameric Replication factor C (RF-C) [Entomophthora muscae]|uniref:Subunit of heteropentameric Replication factor C (RF-C) n=1 Tax=Entomophthora muscae TaxID=34485 RepID=A0ACC2T1Z8_9FUNG|nr:Subunit of heteropentameric Replication factor C (RF-C) [Entomophthora muscae]
MAMSSIESLPWIEKYRPKKIDDISAQEETVRVLKKSLISHNLPHLLFYGPPGTGKTSSILALARELYGPEIFKSRVLELNASDERGISVIREKVKNFARVNVSKNTNSEYPCPPYKIIILDEADSLTSDAQAALRRTMETYSKVTRFCLICNYVTRIIEPLSSRCAKFRFRPISTDLCIDRVKFICEKEGLNYQLEAINRLIGISAGDLRKAIMYLQSAQQFYQDQVITAPAIETIAGVIPDPVIENIFQALGTNQADQLYDAVTHLMNEGYAADSLLSRMHDRMVNMNHLTSLQKARIAQHIGAVDKCLSEGADEELQLLDLFFTVARILVNC